MHLISIKKYEWKVKLFLTRIKRYPHSLLLSTFLFLISFLPACAGLPDSVIAASIWGLFSSILLTGGFFILFYTLDSREKKQDEKVTTKETNGGLGCLPILIAFSLFFVNWILISIVLYKVIFK